MQLDDLVAGYVAGAPSTQLMIDYCLSKSAVLGILHRAGVVRVQTRMSDAQIDQAIRQYAAGWSLAKIEAHLGFTDDTIARALKLRGISLRKPWERSC